MGDDIVTTNVRLDRDTYLRLKQIAAEGSRSLSDVLREASAEYVARREGAVPPGAVRDDPFFRFLESIRAEPTNRGDRDLAVSHDRYLYDEAPKSPRRGRKK